MKKSFAAISALAATAFAQRPELCLQTTPVINAVALAKPTNKAFFTVSDADIVQQLSGDH